MASIISAGTTSATALNMSADTTGILQLASNNGTVALTVNTSQNVGIGTATPTAYGTRRTLAIDGTGGVVLDMFVNGTRTGSIVAETSDVNISNLTSGPLRFTTNSLERGRFDNVGNFLIGTTSALATLTVNGNISPSAGPASYWGLDFASSTSSGTYVTIANNGTYDLAVGSGFVYLWDEGGAGVSQLASYYGSTQVVWQNGSVYSTTSGTASKINFFYNGGTNKYRIQNLTGISINLWISTIRLRNAS